MNEKNGRRLGDTLGLLLKYEKVTLGIILAVTLVSFQLLNPNYLSVGNITNIFIAASSAGIVAVGQTYLMISGHMDLSSGAVAAFSGVLAATLLKNGMNPLAAIIIVLAAGIAIGSLNGFLVTVLRFNHFIATLATQYIFRGFAFILCDGKSVYVKDRVFASLGSRIMNNTVPISVLIMLAVMLVFGIILARTRFGRSTYMVGGNANAARLAGISERKTKMILFSICGCMSSLAGIIIAARMQSGQPASSDGLEFDAITGAVLGGVGLMGGTGDMIGCLIGLLIMTGFNNGLQVLNVQSFWQKVARGLLLIIALGLDYARTVQSQKVKINRTETPAAPAAEKK